MRVLGWCLLVVLLLVQVVGLYSPTAPGPAGPPGTDKLGHLLAFGAPATLAWLLGSRWVVGLLLLHAAVSEPLQGWLAPLRTADPLDALVDVVGVALGVALAGSIRGARRQGRGKSGARTRSEEA